LRTPLNAILGFSDILENQYFGPPGAGKYREYAKDIRTSASHLLDLVDDLLDISAIESGNLNLQRTAIELQPILDDCLRIVSGKAGEKDIELRSLDLPDTALALVDQRTVRQIFLNLLTNAVTFTPEGGVVTLLFADSATTLEVAIKDTGPGIPTDDLERVASPFPPIESDPYTSERGWGMGLVIAHSLARLNGGGITIDSEPGEGTTVTVSLPRPSSSA
jgi:two-component system cell cycle sensor histidine kinase PleC